MHFNAIVGIGPQNFSGVEGDGSPRSLSQVWRPWNERRPVGRRWLAMVESGTCKPLTANARGGQQLREGMVNLTILAPDFVAAILYETLQPELTLFELAVDPPPLWEEQHSIQNSCVRKAAFTG